MSRELSRRANRVALRSWWVGCLACALIVINLGARAAEGEAAIDVELNRLEQRDQDCHIFLVVDNGLAKRFGSLGLDLVLFDHEGTILERVTLDSVTREFA